MLRKSHNLMQTPSNDTQKQKMRSDSTQNDQAGAADS